MHVCTLVGARPQFVKAAAVGRSLKAIGIRETLVHSGQHYDELMSQVFFDELGVDPPASNLFAGSGSHAKQTAEIMIRFDEFIKEKGPFDAVVVYGDTNTTLAGALVASKRNIPIAHIEAGLRSFNWQMPEEINRILTDQVSRWLFAPTQVAVQNLQKEGLSQKTLFVGDVMLDTTRIFSERAKKMKPLESMIDYPPQGYILATVHRPSNTDEGENLQRIFNAFAMIHLPIILPLHPRTKVALTGISISNNVKILHPASYLSMLVLTLNAHRIITDSGGLQKEAYWLGVPCITLRDETEYPETLVHGWNICTGANTNSIVQAINQKQAGVQNQFGHAPNGRASDMIANTLFNDE